MYLSISGVNRNVHDRGKKRKSNFFYSFFNHMLYVFIWSTLEKDVFIDSMMTHHIFCRHKQESVRRNDKCPITLPATFVTWGLLICNFASMWMRMPFSSFLWYYRKDRLKILVFLSPTLCTKRYILFGQGNLTNAV